MGTRVLRAVIATALVLASAAIRVPTADAAPSANVVPSQNQVGYSTLSGVDCVTANDCWAVGSWDRKGVSRTLVEHWNGSDWKVVDSPNADWARDSRLSAVSCVSSIDCNAVGQASSLSSYDLDLPIDPLFMHWDGSAWTVVPGPRNGQKSFIYDQLQAVDCPVSNFCLAVGDRRQGYETLAMRWNGATWAKVPSPNRNSYSQRQNRLLGVACTNRANCFAVGLSEIEFRSGLVQHATLVERWDGSRMRIVASPNVVFSGRDNVLEGVTCPAAKSCIATGYFDAKDAPYGQRTLVLQWNGSTWKVVPSPTPSKQNRASLTGVSCMSATRCFAAGTRDDFARAMTLAQWNGKTWTLVAAPHVAGQPQLRGVACTKRSCFAVGSRAYGQKTLIIRYR